MLNLNQLKEREDLRAQQKKLGDELTFAEEHKLPWGFEGWNSNYTCTISCPEHGDYEQFTLVGKDFAERRLSNIPAVRPASGRSRPESNPACVNFTWPAC